MTLLEFQEWIFAQVVKYAEYSATVDVRSDDCSSPTSHYADITLNRPLGKARLIFSCDPDDPEWQEKFAKEVMSLLVATP